METNTEIIFHLALPADWTAALEEGSYAPAHYALDGFIHCSTSRQLKETAEKYFQDSHELRILVMETQKLGAALKWEPSRNEEMFPHLYRHINPAEDIAYEFTILKNEAGDWQGWEL